MRVQRADGRPSVCLCMIVKNEEAVIGRCLDSVLPYIDAWVISDTGSADRTRETVRDCLAGLPGQLIERSWVDFATNRNQPLEIARTMADYTLMIDADEVLVPQPGFALPPLAADIYHTRHRRHGEDLVYDRALLIRNALPWRYVGVVHEAVVCEQPHSRGRLTGIENIEYPDGARRVGDRRELYAREAEIFENALGDEPGNARYVFYLAQSYKDSGQIQKSIDAYRRRVAMGGWEEERWYAQLQVGRLLLVEGRHAEGVSELLAAFEMRPERAEPLVDLARHSRLRKDWQSALLFARRATEIEPTSDILFVSASAYTWRPWDELGIAAYYVGRYRESLDAVDRALAQPDLPDGDRERIISNRAYSAGKLLRGD